MKVLNVGSGGLPIPDWLTEAMGGSVEEVRLDIDPRVQPDICASMLDMGDIGNFDAVYSNHSLEHLYPHEVPVALAEFKRVLKDGGAAMIFVPNLEHVKATDEVVYECPAGPITGRDMIYGPARFIQDRPYMAHHTGFVPDTLRKECEMAGFSKVESRDVGKWTIFAVAVK